VDKQENVTRGTRGWKPRLGQFGREAPRPESVWDEGDLKIVNRGTLTISPYLIVCLSRLWDFSI